MTPEREKYLACITSRERVIRHAIRMAALSLRETKEWWTKHKTNRPNKIRGYKKTVKRQKLTLMACKRELAKLKGMDRVVVPRDVTFDSFVIGYCQDSFGLVGVCSCGKHLARYKHNYCPNCGRKILWEKVK